MPRTISDLADICHCILLGLVIPFIAFAVVRYDEYGRTLRGKALYAAIVILIIRLTASIRLKTTDPSLCYAWVR